MITSQGSEGRRSTGFRRAKELTLKGKVRETRRDQPSAGWISSIWPWLTIPEPSWSQLCPQGGLGFSVTCDVLCKLHVIPPTPAPSTQNALTFLFSKTSWIPHFPGRSSTDSQIPASALSSPFHRFARHLAAHTLSQWSLFYGSLNCEACESKGIVSMAHHFIRRARHCGCCLSDSC